MTSFLKVGPKNGRFLPKPRAGDLAPWGDSSDVEDLK